MRRTDISEGPFGNLAKGFAKGYQAGRKSPDMLNRAVDKALDPDSYGDSKSEPKKVDWKPIPVEPVKVNPQEPLPQSVKEIPVGTGFKDKQGIMWQWAGQQWVKKTPNGWQAGQVKNDAAFKMYIDALKSGKAYKPITRENQMTKVREGLGDLAHRAEQDHEVQMARAELYKIAKYAIKLHDILKGVSESEGLEGWVQSKITKAAADIGSVYHHLDYQEAEANMPAMAVEAKRPLPERGSRTKKNKAAREDVYKESLRARLEEKKAKNPYAIGMAQAMKSTGDEPPLEKSTIKKAHKIAKAVKKG
jgi:hypothetical protein